MKKQIWLYLLFTFALTWSVWLAAQHFGAGPGNGEYFLSFGSAGPALAALYLSRRQAGTVAQNPLSRLIAFCFFWLLALVVYVLNDHLRGINIHVSRNSYLLVVDLLALLPAWILSGAFARNTGVLALVRTIVRPSHRRWLFIALFFFPAFLCVPAGLAHLLGQPLVWPSHHRLISPIASAAVLFLNSFLFTAVFEEPGWRGFLLPRLQQSFPPALASLLLWFPWALWHAPLDISSGLIHSPMRYLQIRVIFLLPMTVIFTWLYNRSSGNLLCVALFHASMNTFPFVLPYFPPALVLLILFAVLVIFTDRMWRKRPPAALASPEP